MEQKSLKLQKGFLPFSLVFTRFIYQEQQEPKSQIPIFCAKGSVLSDAAVVHVLLPGDVHNGPCSVLKCRGRFLSTPLMPTLTGVLQATLLCFFGAHCPLSIFSTSQAEAALKEVKQTHLR